MGYLIGGCHAGESVRILVNRQGIKVEKFPPLGGMGWAGDRTGGKRVTEEWATAESKTAKEEKRPTTELPQASTYREDARVASPIKVYWLFLFIRLN